MRKVLLVTKNNRGFSLVEAIIAAGIFAIITTSIVASYFSVSKYLLISSVETQAIFLAEEGLEAVRNIRDNDFTKLVSGGPYGLSSSGNVWNFSGSQDTRGIYTRKISITAPDDDTREVSSLIEWNYKGENKSLALKRQFNNWRKGKLNAISRWKFDDNSGCTASDSNGTNNGTLRPNCSTNSPLWSTTTKKVGTSALTFDGSDDYVQVSDANSLDLSTAGTLMAWIYPTRNQTNGIITKGSAAGTLAYYLRLDTGRRLNGGGVNSAGTTLFVQAHNTSLVTLNVWTHVAFTWDATSMKIYIDGVLSSPANTTVLNARNTTGTLQFGATYPTSNRFQGTIDEVSIYNAALSAADILNIYNSQK